MCLSTLLSDEEKTKFLKNKPKTITGYKVFALDVRKNQLTEPYGVAGNHYHFMWNRNTLLNDDTFDNEADMISYKIGFHLFVNKTAANNLAKFMKHVLNMDDSNQFYFFRNKTIVALPVTFKQKDIIVMGEQRYSTDKKDPQKYFGQEMPKPALSYVVREFNVPLPKKYNPTNFNVKKYYKSMDYLIGK